MNAYNNSRTYHCLANYYCTQPCVINRIEFLAASLTNTNSLDKQNNKQETEEFSTQVAVF